MTLNRGWMVALLALLCAGLAFGAALLVVMSQNAGTVHGGLYVYGP